MAVSTARMASVLACAALAACQQAAGTAATTPGAPLAYEHRIAAFGGELLGSDRGEFGGELAFRSQEGRIIPLVGKNVKALYKTPSGYVAITGLAHLSTNEGEALSITHTGPNRFKVDRIALLPAAPIQTRLLPGGTVEMRLFEGDFSPAGLPLHACWRLEPDERLHQATCADDWREPKPWTGAIDHVVIEARA